MSRITEHNKEVRNKAESRAAEMISWPSPLEERMKRFLEEHWIFYEEQKIFYIFDEDGWIKRFFIADFYIPDKHIIIEVDGKFHNDHKQHDKERTRILQQHYPGLEVLRYQWGDLSDRDKMDDLLYKIR